MATRTSVGSGLWSAPGTWNTGVPVDGDSFVVAAGHTVTFDADQSSMPTGMAEGTINGTLQASEVAGAYVLKWTGTITVGSGGKLRVGTSEAVPYPATCSMLFQASSASRITSATAGNVLIYCSCPTYRTARLTAPAGIGDTVLSVDTDLRGDWVDGQTVYISDIDSGVDVEARTIAVGGVAASTLTVTVSLASAKLAGAYLILGSRNVRMTGSGSTALGLFYTCVGVQVAAQIDSTYTVEYAGNRNVFLRGAVTFNGSGTLMISRESVMIELRGVHGGLSGQIGVGIPFGKLSGAHLFGWSHATYGTVIEADKTLITGCANGINRAAGTLTSCLFIGNSSDSGGGTSYPLTLYNTTMGLPGAGFAWDSTIIQSFDHAGSAGAFRARTLGGLVSDTAAVVVTGRPRSYQHACASATYPCWHQREITVDAGRQLRARVWLRHEAGVAVVAQLVLPTDDPLLDAAATAEDTFDASALAADTWHEDVLVWTNTATYPQQILLRFLATAASGYAYSDFEWAFDRTPRGRHGIA